MAGTTLQLKGLGAKAMSDVARKAKRLGMTPERYLRDLVEQDLALDRIAKDTTLSKLMGPGRAVDEGELDQLVEAARIRHHQRSLKRGK